MCLPVFMTSVLIIGGGISGLMTAHRLQLDRPQVELLLVEGAAQVGGVVRSQVDDGLVFEWGPNAFMGPAPETFRLIRELGLTDQLVSSGASAKKRYLVKHGRLIALPRSPLGMLSTRALSLSGRLRLLSEPFQPTGDGTHESVATFGRRRVGAEATSMLLDPMVSGVYAGDVERISIAAAFPRVAALEREHGSLLRGMVAQGKKRRAERRNVQSADRQESSGGQRGVLYSFRHGLGELTTALGESLSRCIQTDRSAQSVARSDDGYVVSFVDGSSVAARALLVATPAPRAATLLGGALPDLAGHLEAIPYAPIAVVCLAYRRSQVSHPLDGFGFLAPRQEGRRVLGAIWVSTVYPDHAPADVVSLRVMIGGAHDPEVVGKPADELVGLAHTDLCTLLKVEGEPIAHSVYRHPLGIPQYNVGHRERLAKIDSLIEASPGLFLTGNAYRGVGVNDCIVQGAELAEKIGRYLDEMKDSAS